MTYDLVSDYVFLSQRLELRKDIPAPTLLEVHKFCFSTPFCSYNDSNVDTGDGESIRGFSTMCKKNGRNGT